MNSVVNSLFRVVSVRAYISSDEIRTIRTIPQAPNLFEIPKVSQLLEDLHTTNVAASGLRKVLDAVLKEPRKDYRKKKDLIFVSKVESINSLPTSTSLRGKAQGVM